MRKERIKTTWVCHWRPNRTVARTYKEQDAARIMCYVVRSGGTMAEILKRFKSTCPEQPNVEWDRALEIALQAQQVASDNMDTLNGIYNLFLLLNGLLLGLLALPVWLRRTPALAIVFRGIGPLQQQVAAQVTVLGNRIAANEALYQAASVALRLRKAA